MKEATWRERMREESDTVEGRRPKSKSSQDTDKVMCNMHIAFTLREREREEEERFIF